jgi:hypothetical protein
MFFSLYERSASGMPLHLHEQWSPSDYRSKIQNHHERREWDREAPHRTYHDSFRGCPNDKPPLLQPSRQQHHQKGRE